MFNVYSFVSESEIDCWVEQLPFLFPNKAQVFKRRPITALFLVKRRAEVVRVTDVVPFRCVSLFK